MQKRFPIKNWLSKEGLSDQLAVGPMGCRTNGMSECWDVTRVNVKQHEITLL